METNKKKNGKDIVVEDGHPASFRNADGSMKNIYADDGNLTEEGKMIMLLRETLSKETRNDEKADKERKRKRKLIGWSVSAVAIVFFLLFFHVYISIDGGIAIYAKSTPTFSYTFIDGREVDAVLKRYNNASIFEKVSMRDEPFVKLLFDKGILYNKENVNVDLTSINELVNESNNNGQQTQESLNEQTEYYNYYNYQRYQGDDNWKELNAKIIFGKKEIKVITPEKTRTFIIMKIDENLWEEDGTDLVKYDVYDSNDVNKKIVVWRSGYGYTSVSLENVRWGEIFTKEK